ncbi:MAG: DnaJ family domain-containing protein [Burkholderiales bacterium]
MLDDLVEQRIQSSIRCGDFDNLPGRGKPLELGDDSLIAPELRMTFRILKNSGYVPAEVKALNDVFELECFIRDLDSASSERRLAIKRLEALKLKLGNSGCFIRVLENRQDYFRRICRKLDKREIE